MTTRILLVDNDPDLREILAGWLQDEGYLVRTTPLEDALETFKSEPIGLVVTATAGSCPAHAPIARRLLRAASASATPVGVYTAWPIDAAQTASMGFAFALQKPSSAERLLTAIRRFARP
jgi:DNA-binding response OmpR family regulator